MESIEVRVARLERENRWLKRAGLVGLLLIGLLAVVELARPQPVVAQAVGPMTASGFYVVDRQGQIRAGLSMNNSQSAPQLALYAPPRPGSQSQQPLALITLSDAGEPVLAMSPPSGGGPSLVVVANIGGAQLSMGPIGSGWGLSLNAQPDGSGSAAISDSSGQPLRQRAPAPDGGAASAQVAQHLVQGRTPFAQPLGGR